MKVYGPDDPNPYAAFGVVAPFTALELHDTHVDTFEGSLPGRVNVRVVGSKGKPADNIERFIWCDHTRVPHFKRTVIAGSGFMPCPDDCPGPHWTIERGEQTPDERPEPDHFVIKMPPR